MIALDCLVDAEYEVTRHFHVAVARHKSTMTRCKQEVTRNEIGLVKTPNRRTDEVQTKTVPKVANI